MPSPARLGLYPSTLISEDDAPVVIGLNEVTLEFIRLMRQRVSAKVGRTRNAEGKVDERSLLYDLFLHLTRRYRHYITNAFRLKGLTNDEDGKLCLRFLGSFLLRAFTEDLHPVFKAAISSAVGGKDLSDETYNRCLQALDLVFDKEDFLDTVWQSTRDPTVVCRRFEVDSFADTLAIARPEPGIWLTLDDMVMRTKSKSVWNRIVIVRKGVGQSVDAVAESQTSIVLGIKCRGRSDPDGPVTLLTGVCHQASDAVAANPAAGIRFMLPVTLKYFTVVLDRGYSTLRRAIALLRFRIRMYGIVKHNAVHQIRVRKVIVLRKRSRESASAGQYPAASQRGRGRGRPRGSRARGRGSAPRGAATVAGDVAGSIGYTGRGRGAGRRGRSRGGRGGRGGARGRASGHDAISEESHESVSTGGSDHDDEPVSVESADEDHGSATSQRKRPRESLDDSTPQPGGRDRASKQAAKDRMIAINLATRFAEEKNDTDSQQESSDDDGTRLFRCLFDHDECWQTILVEVRRLGMIAYLSRLAATMVAVMIQQLHQAARAAVRPLQMKTRMTLFACHPKSKTHSSRHLC